MWFNVCVDYLGMFYSKILLHVSCPILFGFSYFLLVNIYVLFVHCKYQNVVIFITTILLHLSLDFLCAHWVLYYIHYFFIVILINIGVFPTHTDFTYLENLRENICFSKAILHQGIRLAPYPMRLTLGIYLKVKQMLTLIELVIR